MSTPSEGTCRSCHAPVLWAQTEKAWIPLDPTPVEDGNVILERGRAVVLGPLELLVDEHDERYVAHFTTCPDAATWRR